MTADQPNTDRAIRRRGLAAVFAIAVLIIAACGVMLRARPEQVGNIQPPLSAGHLWKDLPGGARIEVLGVLQAYDNQPWWKADGSRQTAPAESHGRALFSDDVETADIRRIRLKLTGLRHTDHSPQVILDPNPKRSFGWSARNHGTDLSNPDSRAESIVESTLIPDSDTATARLGLRLEPVGPQVPVRSDGTLRIPADMSDVLKTLYESVIATIETVPDNEPAPVDGPSRIRTWLTVTRQGPGADEPLIVRAVAQTRSGRFLTADGPTTGTRFGFTQPSEQIHEFTLQLQSGSRTWVTVENISLKMGQATKPTIRVTTSDELPPPDELAAWTQRLDNGAIVSLLALSRPKAARGIWWSPAGQLVSPPSQEHLYQDRTFASMPFVGLVRVREESDGKPIPRLADGQSRLNNWYFYWKEIEDTDPRYPGSQLFLVSIAERTESGAPQLSMGVGAGEWTAASELQLGEVIQLDGASYVAQSDQLMKAIRLVSSYRPDREARIVAKANGRTHLPEQAPRIETRHGPRWQEGEVRTGGLVRTHEWPEGMVADLELQTRSRDWATFSGFAIHPLDRDFGPVEFARSENLYWPAVPLIRVMKEAAGPLDGFADRFADQFRTALERKDISFLKDEHLDAIRDDFRGLLEQHLPAEFPRDQQLPLLTATGWYLTHNVATGRPGLNWTSPTSGSFWGESSRDYFYFGNAMKNLKWRIWSLLTSRPTADDQRELEAQFEWMREAIRKEEAVQPESRSFVKLSLLRFDEFVADPFSAGFQTPLSPEDFAALKETIETKYTGTGHARVLHALLGSRSKAPRRDDPIAIPFDPEGIYRISMGRVPTKHSYRYQCSAKFRSERRETGYIPQLKDWRVVDEWTWPAIFIGSYEGGKVEFPDDPDERLQFLKQSDFADLAFDLQERSLISFRDARFALLDTHDWSVADTYSDDALVDHLQVHGQDSVEVSPFFVGDPDEIWSPKGPQVMRVPEPPLIAIQNREGELAVLSVNSTYMTSQPNRPRQRLLNVRMRRRPLKSRGYLGQIGVLPTEQP